VSTQLATPRSTRSGSSVQTKRPSISEITGKGSGLPNRYILHATEGWGKTSLGAQTPKPIFIQTGAETGLETLIDAGRLEETSHFPAAQTWEDVLGSIETLRVEDHPFRTVVLDTMNGAESLCHQFICHRDFGDDWGNKGFASYGKGYEVALPEWSRFLNALDRLRIERKMTIFVLCHTKVKPFKNPEGPDFDRYQPDVHEKTWSLSHKWADAVLFGNFEVTVAVDKADAKRGKGMGGKIRMMYTERSAAYDAKNRLGLPTEIEMGESPAEAWEVFMAAIKAGRQIQKQEAVQ
jgi:AAA domain